MTLAHERKLVGLAALAVLLAGLALPGVAEGFFSRGTIDAELGYADLQIYRDQEEYWAGSVFTPARRSGRRHGYRWSPYGFVSRDEYYLNGVLENLSGRSRVGLQVVFYASDCVRERIHWSVTVAVDHLGPHQSLPFREFISYAEPVFPCRFQFHVIEESVPESPPEPEEPIPSLPLGPPAQDTPPSDAPYREPPAPDDAPIYKWVDVNGVTHYTNRTTRFEDKQWEPAWKGQ